MAVLVASGALSTRSATDEQRAQRRTVLRRYGLDPASSLDSRVKEPSAAVLKMFTVQDATDAKASLTEATMLMRWPQPVQRSGSTS
jgi:hypothetical protein